MHSRSRTLELLVKFVMALTFTVCLNEHTRADITLTFVYSNVTDAGSDQIASGTLFSGLLPTNGNLSPMSGSQTFNGNTLDYTLSVLNGGSNVSYSLTGSFTSSNTFSVFPNELSLQVTDTAATLSGNITQSSFLSTNVSNLSTTNDSPYGYANNLGSYYTPSNSGSTAGSSLTWYQDGMYSSTGANNTPFNVAPMTGRFSGTTVLGMGPSNSSTVGFTSTQTIYSSVASLPEPSGIIAAIIGLPCMGALVRRVRRNAV